MTMVQATDLRDRNDPDAEGWFKLAFDSRVALQGQVGLRVQIVVEVRSQDATEMPFVENDAMIEALAVGRSDQAFRAR